MKKFIICFLIGLIFLLPVNKVLADEQPDLEKKGSIVITLRDTNGNIVKGGTITVQKVADISYDKYGYSYVYTEQFTDSEYPLDKTSSPELAKNLQKYALDNGIDGNTYNNTDGKIEIDDLTAGLYLICQETESEGYFAIVPFLVSMPYYMDGKWIYDVDASPKLSPVNQKTIIPEPTTEVETKTETETKTEPKTEKESKTQNSASVIKPEGTYTGDEAPVMIYAYLMCIAMLLGGISFVGKKRFLR